jgi:hypothetical protein
MELKRAEHSFRFVSQHSLIELTGLKVRNLADLLSNLKTVPGSVIYYHTHHYLKQHQFLSPEPANDFAYWVSNVLQDDKLGEQLAAIDTVRFPSIKALREAIVHAIEKYLSTTKTARVAPEGEEFHIMKSKSFIFPTPFEAFDLRDFVECVKKVSHQSLYHHIFEARLRLERASNDFSDWLEKELGEKALAHAIGRLDPYTQTMEGLRQKIIRLAEKRLMEHSTGAAHAN